MIRYLTNLLDVATERRLRAFLLGVGAAAVVTMFAITSLGFGAFAAFGYLRPVEGPAAAALILCAASGAARARHWRVHMDAPSRTPNASQCRRFDASGECQFVPPRFHRDRRAGSAIDARRGDAVRARHDSNAACRAGADRRLHRRQEASQVRRVRKRPSLRRGANPVG